MMTEIMTARFLKNMGIFATLDQDALSRWNAHRHWPPPYPTPVSDTPLPALTTFVMVQCVEGDKTESLQDERVGTQTLGNRNQIGMRRF